LRSRIAIIASTRTVSSVLLVVEDPLVEHGPEQERVEHAQTCGEDDQGHHRDQAVCDTA